MKIGPTAVVSFATNLRYVFGLLFVQDVDDLLLAVVPEGVSAV